MAYAGGACIRHMPPDCCLFRPKQKFRLQFSLTKWDAAAAALRHYVFGTLFAAAGSIGINLCFPPPPSQLTPPSGPPPPHTPSSAGRRCHTHLRLKKEGERGEQLCLQPLRFSPFLLPSPALVPFFTSPSSASLLAALLPVAASLFPSLLASLLPSLLVSLVPFFLAFLLRRKEMSYTFKKRNGRGESSFACALAASRHSLCRPPRSSPS